MLPLCDGARVCNDAAPKFWDNHSPRNGQSSSLHVFKQLLEWTRKFTGIIFKLVCNVFLYQWSEMLLSVHFWMWRCHIDQNIRPQAQGFDNLAIHFCRWQRASKMPILGRHFGGSVVIPPCCNKAALQKRSSQKWHEDDVMGLLQITF